MLFNAEHLIFCICNIDAAYREQTTLTIWWNAPIWAFAIEYLEFAHVNWLSKAMLVREIRVPVSAMDAASV
jgi:hypothetical protein